MDKNGIRIVIVFVLLCFITGNNTNAIERFNYSNYLLAEADSVAKSDTAKNDTTKVDKFEKLTKDAQSFSGMFNAWIDKKNNMYLEVSERNLGKLYLLSSRVSEISDNSSFSAGEMLGAPFMFRLSADSSNVYMHRVYARNRIAPNDPIMPSFKRNNREAIMKTFPIKATSNDSIRLIDVTSFFASNEECITPLRYSMRAQAKRNASFDSSASRVEAIKSFNKNVEITSQLNYTSKTGPYLVVVRRSILELPDKPMAIRFQDNRVGYFSSRFTYFDSNEDRVEEDTYIHRWRLEPKKEDMKAYFEGKLVEPRKPIVFYVDTAFPKKWSGAVKQGIMDWNKAFEKAGFKNAVVARDYPKEVDGVAFDPDDISYNCIRYITTAIPNASGPSFVDPRSGEIICADVMWYHNVTALINVWRLVQTGAVDKRVRSINLPDDVMSESLRYVASHEIGHTLGLMHNMGASFAFPVDSLRSPSFTQKYGTTPSIMDYARNNYVAQPGDFEKGVRLVPPLLGVYDKYAINWGYRLFPNITEPKQEYPHLNSIIEEHANDPMYKFGAQQIFVTEDPTDQTEDLSNDHIKATALGLKNLYIVIGNLNKWFAEPNKNYDNIKIRYYAALKQYTRLLTHLIPYLGGVEYNDIVQDNQNVSALRYISKEKQHEVMEFLVNEVLTCSDKIMPTALIHKLGLKPTMMDGLQSSVASKILAPDALGRIYEGERTNNPNLYTVSEYINDAYDILFASLNNNSLTQEERNLQDNAVDALLKLAGLKHDGKALDLKKYKALAIDSDMLYLGQTETDNVCNVGSENSYSRHNMKKSYIPTKISAPIALDIVFKLQKRYKRAANKMRSATDKAFCKNKWLVLNKLINKN